MTAPSHPRLQALAAALLVSAPLAELPAQMQRTADPNAPRLVVQVFRSGDKNAGVQAADAIRNRISQDVSLKQLWVLPKVDITRTLEASGFPADVALNMGDARQLAQQLRGDVFLVGDVSRDSAGTGFQVDARYVLTRDASLVQPLGTFRVNKASDAAGAVSRAFQDAQKAFVAERNCVNRARDGKFPEAIAEARKGIAAYPTSTLARICLANIMQEQKASPDEILAVTSEVLKIDPKSKPALTTAYTALKAAKRDSAATDVLLELVGADPSNARLLEQVVNELAANGQAIRAIKFVDQLVRENEGDPNYRQLQMRVHLAAKSYKVGIEAGEALIAADTAQATPALFERLITAAGLIPDLPKAAQLVAQAAARFPANTSVWITYADILVAAGQHQQVVDALAKVLAANPKAPGVNSKRAISFHALNQSDSALAAAQVALAAGDSAATVAPIMVGVLQQKLKDAKTADDYRALLPLFEAANAAAETPAGHLLYGQAQFQLGYALYQDVQKLAASRANRAAACAAATASQSALAVAQVEITKGGRASAQAAQQMLTNLGQLMPATDQAAKALCAAGR